MLKKKTEALSRYRSVSAATGRRRIWERCCYLHPQSGLNGNIGHMDRGRVLAQMSFISLSQPRGVTTAQPAIRAKNCISNQLADKHAQSTEEIAPHFNKVKAALS